MNLAEVRAVVTGGGSGIGRAVAERMVRAEGKVMICGRNGQKLEKTAEQIGADFRVADVSSEKDIAALFEAALSRFGSLNVLINNAGFGSFAPLLEVDPAGMRGVWETNVLGAAIAAREAARTFIRQKTAGNIINVASTAGQRGFAGGTSYVASKFALRGMTECWRAELRQHDIRVMLISPSEVQTPFFESSGRARRLSERKLQASDIADAIMAMLSMEDRAFITELSVWATNPD